MKILLIADNHATAGSGHVARMLALAEAAVTLGHDPVIAIPEGVARPPASWGPVPCPIVPEANPADLGVADLVIVDSYRHLPRLVADYGHKPVVAYDDVAGLIGTGLEAIVNPNVGAERFGYFGVALAYCGARYATIRPGFRELRRVRAGAVQTILVGLGGTGNLDAWPRIALSLGRAPLAGVTVLLYGNRPHPVEWYAGRLPRVTLRTVDGYQDALAAFAVADLAIVGIGVTALECLACGIPTIVYSAHEETQAPLLGPWRSAGFPTLNRTQTARLIRDTATRERLSRASLDKVDGQGARRVIEAVTLSPGPHRATAPGIRR
jgi:spore coat polysaccharide biosynthesis predicted glycosyltransferase SpsG